MFFEPNINLHKIYFKGFGKEGIKLKICISIQNNFICALILNSLFGDLQLISAIFHFNQRGPIFFRHERTAHHFISPFCNRNGLIILLP